MRRTLTRAAHNPLLSLTKKGLFCRAGNFYIDPMGAVDHAVITHAHADHARKGSRNYYCAASGVALLKARIGANISVQGIPFREVFDFGSVRVSFHPAGHILGSSQVRIEAFGEVWVASGDYKRDADPTCEPFEVVPCDTFVTEATFGTPAYVWPKDVDLGLQIAEWWHANSAREVNSVLFAYSLGKAQRVLGALATHARKPIYCHSAVTPINNCYRAQGIQLAPTKCLSSLNGNETLKGELFLVPQAFLKTAQAAFLGEGVETAFASGWMAKATSEFQRGFMSSTVVTARW